MIGVNFGTLCHIFTMSRSPYRESLLRRVFSNFEQLGGPAAINPIRACARILYSFRSKHWCVVADDGRAHESFAKCKLQPTILHRNFSQSLQKKDLQCFKKRFKLVRLTLPKLPFWQLVWHLGYPNFAPFSCWLKKCLPRLRKIADNLWSRNWIFC